MDKNDNINEFGVDKDEMVSEEDYNAFFEKMGIEEGDDLTTETSGDDESLDSMSMEAAIGTINGYQVVIESKDFEVVAEKNPNDSHLPHVHIVKNNQTIVTVDIPEFDYDNIPNKIDPKTIIVEKNLKYHGKENLDNNKFKKDMASWYVHKDKNGKTNLEKAYEEWQKSKKAKRPAQIGHVHSTNKKNIKTKGRR